VRQAGMLFSAQTASMFVGLLVSLIQARWMDPAEMGRFAFCFAIIIVTGIFFEFGIFSAGARVLALEHDSENQRRALGALVLMTTIISLAFSVFIALMSLPIDWLFGKNVRWLLLATAALTFFQPFQNFIELCCHGLNRIRLLSLFQLLLSGSYLILLITLVAAHRLTAGLALAAYLASTAVATVWTITRLRPVFKDVSPIIKQTLHQVRDYGLNLYLARVIGIISGRADQLAIAYFLTDAAPLGIYALVQKFSNPISMMGRSLAVTRFRAFAKLSRVPGRITRWNAVVLIAASVALIVIGPLAIRLLFPKYSDGTPLLLPFALMNLFTGLYQPYNIFLTSHGRGAEVRNIVVLVVVASLAGLIWSVPHYGIMGAAWTAAAAMATDYVLHVYYYRKFTRAVESATS
jgi:O-antigen/teichoic acid export membrane protein